MSIRWYPKAPWWALIRHEPDFDAPGHYFVETLAVINVCPWCGKRLYPAIYGSDTEDWKKRLDIDLEYFRELRK